MPEPGRDHTRAFIPSTDEVLALVGAMYRGGDLEARKAMKPFMGTRHGDLALPHVKRQASRILNDPKLLVNRRLREQIKDFAAQYGLQVRGQEPANERVGVRLTTTQMNDIREAMRILKVKDMTRFVREAALEKARDTIDGNRG